MKNISVDLKLKERVKELKCLYAISKIAWEVDNDLNAILTKALTIVPQAMQFPALAEANIEVGNDVYDTPGFSKCKTVITASLNVGKKRYGVFQIGYRKGAKATQEKQLFLKEEKKLISMVARELSLYIKRASIEEDKKKLQIQLKHADRLAFVGELSAGIAHELNEPMGRILGFAQLIKKEGLSSEQQNDDIDRIIKASLYSREIIKKLMLFSRQMPQRLVAVDLNESIENILSFIDMRYQSKHINIVSRLEPKLSKMQADPVQISQVIVNLLTNAIYAMGTGGDLIISTHMKAGNVMMIVKDTGYGMTSDVQKKIFEPFFTTKPVGHGTGLGLSVVHGIVLDHQGSIKVRSVPGKGTTFEIVFPLKRKKTKKA